MKHVARGVMAPSICQLRHYLLVERQLLEGWLADGRVEEPVICSHVWQLMAVLLLRSWRRDERESGSRHLSVEWMRETESPKYRGNIGAQIMNRVQSCAFQADHRYSAVDRSNCCDTSWNDFDGGDIRSQFPLGHFIILSLQLLPLNLLKYNLPKWSFVM